MPALALSRTEEVDRIVEAAASGYLSDTLDTPYALLAVGGYGRRELFPHSDIDLILLLRHEPDSARLKEPLSHFLRALWDSSLKASQSVRTVDECCRLNETNPHLSISLLDVRFLCGSPQLFQSLTERLPEFFQRHSRQLLEALAALTRSRHAKFDNTVYHLEPNIKEGPGGLRDVHFVEWAAKLAPSKEPLQHAVAEVGAARAFLSEVRLFLHERWGRDNNLLSFELQDQAAAALPSSPVSPESWMRVFYRHARTGFQSSLQVLDFLDRSPSGLVRQFFDRRDRLSTAEFTVSHNQVFLRNPAGTLSSLSSIFELLTFVARAGTPLAWDTQRRLRQHASTLPASSPQTVGWQDWRLLLSQPHAALALREMQDAGILAIVFPEWKSVESLVVRDFYHRYTVDEHTLVAITAIDNLLADTPGTLPRYRELAHEEEQIAALRMALLLHDIGKGTTPGDHVRGSLEQAGALLTHLQAPEPERTSIEFLITNHLLLSQVMNGRDLDDPATGRDLSSAIGTYEQLRKLTLLTFADISAVNPTAMTPWRAEQLWRVYSVVSEQLTRELASDRIHRSPEAAVSTLARPELARFIEGFPTRYSHIHSSDQLEQHFHLEQIRQRDGIALDIRAEPGVWVMTVLTADHPGLFAALCGTLASFGMNIVKAEAASNAGGSALDEFRFADPTQTLDLNPAEIERLRWTVECVIKGAIEVSDLLKRRRPPPRHSSLPPSAPSVRFDNTASDSSTLLHFAGDDRPGLLFELASVLTEAGCDIEVVLVNTEGHRAIDVFYITKNGTKLGTQSQDPIEARLASIR